MVSNIKVALWLAINGLLIPITFSIYYLHPLKSIEKAMDATRPRGVKDWNGGAAWFFIILGMTPWAYLLVAM